MMDTQELLLLLVQARESAKKYCAIHFSGHPHICVLVHVERRASVVVGSRHARLGCAVCGKECSAGGGVCVGLIFARSPSPIPPRPPRAS